MDVPKTEQVFFADPALDRAVAMIMTLAAELHVTRDRLHALEALLVRRGVLEPDALDHYAPDAAARQRGAADRDAYVRELMRCVLAEPASKGAPADITRRFP